MYGKSIYGIERYAYDKEQEELSDEYFVNLARYAPAFMAEIREMAEIYRTQGFEIGKLQNSLREMLEQCFVETATWGLLRWEETYGIITNLALSYEQRREIILAKIRGQGTVTRKMIEDTATAFSGGEVQVIEEAKRYHFIVRFVGIKGIPRNMQAFINMLEEIKPAHLSYEFKYTYTVWGNLKPFTWGTLKNKTWGEIKVMEGV